jgi:AcrR family transcriptional regulator
MSPEQEGTALARRDRIVAAARAIAVEEGWPAVSVRRVAARAGCSAAAIYQYLPDKAAIISAIAADGEDQMATAMRAAVTDVSGAGKRVRAAARAYWRFVEENPALYRVMHGLDGMPAPPRSGRAAILDDLAAGLIKKHALAADPADVSDSLGALLHGFAAAALQDRMPLDRAGTLLQAAVDAWLKGLAKR